MKKYKILVSDYDGTLANSQNFISKTNLDAINSFIARGGIFVLCSGRATDGISKILLSQNFKGLLASFNGAQLYDLNEKKVIFSNGISGEILCRIVKYCMDNALNFHVYPEEGFICPKPTWYSAYYEKVTGVPPIFDDDILKTVQKTNLISPKVLIFDDKEKLDAHYNILKNLTLECQVSRSTDNMIDINLDGVNKGTACDMIAKHFGLTIDDVIGVGDAGNDYDMIKLAGLSFAVSNATEEIKDLADIVLPVSNDENAIAYIIENYCI